MATITLTSPNGFGHTQADLEQHAGLNPFEHRGETSASGDAQFYGSTGNIQLNKPIVGMTSTPDGGGHWFVASDGGLFNYGSAAFAGGLGDAGVTDAAGMSLGL